MLDIFLLKAHQDLQPCGGVGGDGLYWQLLPARLWGPGKSVEISEALILSFLLHLSEAGIGPPLCPGGPWQRHTCPCPQVDS